MENLTQITQIVIGASVAYVWIFRFHNVLKEFEEFGLSDVTRNFVGVSKIALSTLLVVGIWYPTLIFIPAIMMGFFMVSAQYFHFTVKNSFVKHLPSLILLLLSAFVAVSSM